MSLLKKKSSMSFKELSEEELESVLSSMKESAYLNFKVDLEKVSSKNAGYNNLSLKEKKEVLIQTLDMNQLYLSYSEMEDEQYDIPEDVKAFNHSFYDKEGVKDDLQLLLNKKYEELETLEREESENNEN